MATVRFVAGAARERAATPRRRADRSGTPRAG
jgi:hypothetical protein